MTEIVIEHTGQYFRWQCDFCGETQEKDGMWASIGPRVSDDSMEICKRCLDAGPEGVIERAKKYANRLQDHVNFLTNDIPGIVRSVNTWKTGVDYKAVYDTGEAEIKKLCEEEEIEVFEPDAPDTQESQNDDIPF